MKYRANKKIKLVFTVALIAGLTAGGALFPPDAEAVQIKRVQSGTHLIDDALVSTATIPIAVNMSKSVLFFTIEVIDGSSADYPVLFRGWIDDPSHIMFSRDYGSATGVNVDWYILEFEDGVKVQRGGTSFQNNGANSKDIVLPIELEDSTQAFPLINCGGYLTGTQYTHIARFLGSFPDSQTFRMERFEGRNDTNSLRIAYQVVEFLTDFRARSGTVEIPYNGSSATVDLSGDPIADINKAFLIITFAAGPGVDGYDNHLFPRATITDVDTLTFNRGSSGSSEDFLRINWVLFEFEDSSSYVQKAADQSLGTSSDLPLSPAVDLTRAFSILTTAIDGSSQGYFDDSMVRGLITDSTTLHIARGQTASTTRSDYFVVEFAPLTLTAPNDGEVWYVGDTENITWKHAAVMGSGGTGPGGHHRVDLKLSKNAGGDGYPLTIVAGIDGTLDTYAWTIPATLDPGAVNVIGDQLMVKIIDTDMAGPRNFDVSKNTFEIKGTLTLTAPNGVPGTVWNVGDTDRYIMWDKTGDLSYTTFSVYLSEDGGSTFPTLVADMLEQADCCSGDSCSYNWTPIPDKVGTDRRLYLYIAADEAGVNSTTVDFEIRPKLVLTYPVGGELFSIGGLQTITWDAYGAMPGGIQIARSTNGGLSYTPLASGISAAGGSWDWTPVSAPASTETRIEVRSLDYYSTVHDESAADFEVRAVVTVDIPSGTGIVWRVGQSRDIEYTINGTVPLIDVLYATVSSPGDLDFTAITPGQGVSTVTYPDAYPWTVPNAVSDTCTIRIQDHDDTNIKDDSDNYFKIKGMVSVSNPGAAEVVKVCDTGETYTIQWAVTGTVSGTADIALSLNGGSSYDITLTEGIVDINAGSYNWTVLAGHLGNDCKIKVALDGDESLTSGTAGESGSFYVKPQVKLTYPNESGIVKSIGDVMTVTWDAIPDTFGTVMLKYSTNGAAGPYDGTINVAAINSDLETYDWTILDVPGMVSQNVRVKVYKTDDETGVHDESAYDFVVKGTITLTGEANGVGGPVWEAGIAENITWNKVGDLGTVRIQFSKDATPNYAYEITSGIDCTDLSYAWSLPNGVFTTLAFERTEYARIRIVSESDGSISDTTDTAFVVQSRLSLTQPIGGETLEVAQPGGYNITWTTYGRIPQVKLAYSTNSGGDGYDKNINAGAAISNLDAYSWTVPNAIGDALRIKLMSFNNQSDIVDTSPGDFKIKGRVEVVAPDLTVAGVNAWRVDNAAAGLASQESIVWNNYGSLGGGSDEITIMYAADGSTFDTTVTTTANGTNGLNRNYLWTIPGNVGTTNKIAVVDESHANADLHIFQESEQFEIKGQIKLTAPTGGETYLIGGVPIDIEWVYAGSLGNINLHFSDDDGATWNPAFATVAVGYSQPYQWTVPDSPTTEAKIKLEQASDSTVNSEEFLVNKFRIRGSVFIGATPNASTVWTVTGASNVIEWTLTGSIANVAIDLDTVSGTGGYTEVVVASVAAAGGTYTWTIPSARYTAVTTDNARIRIRDTTDSSVSDTSAADFKIKPVIDVTSPVGGEHWAIGTSHNITWVYYGNIPQVKIEYSLDGGGTWQAPPIHSGYDASALQYPWTIPDTADSDIKVKLSKATDPDVSGQSPAWFEIMGSLELTQPDGGVNLPVTTSYDIKWIPTGTIGNVKLEYSTDAAHTVWNPVAGAASLTPGASGVETSFAWTVPNACSPTVKVRVAEVSNPTYVTDDSDEDNAIIGNIDVIHPMNGEEMVVGESYIIEWSYAGNIQGFDIEYHDGTSWNPVTASSLSAGTTTYNWDPVDDNISSTVKVRVKDKDNANVFDESTDDNIIKGSIDLTDPDGYENLSVGQSFAITWTKTGSIGNLLIEYSNDDFNTDLHQIHPSYAADSPPYAWTVPDFIDNSVKVRVTSIGGIPVTDKSGNVFSIKGSFTNMSPNGGQIWYVGAADKIITWTANGSIAGVDIRYKTSPSGSYDGVIVLGDGGHTSGSNQYAWTAGVADENSEDCYIRISDSSDSAVYIESAAAFSIRPVITVTQPPVNSNMVVGSSYPNAVVWSLNGSAKVSEVDVLYSSNGVSGPFDKTIASGVDATLGQADWNNVGNYISDDVIVRVIDKSGGTGNPNVYGHSPSFDIIGSITVQQPAASANWEVGTSRNITWTYTGAIGTVNIYYDYGSGYGTPIASVPVADQSYTWDPIPDTVSETVKVKIADADNESEVYDESDTFKIRGGFTITFPNSLEVLISGTGYDITWTRNGTAVSNVILEFSSNNGGAWSTIDANASNTGTYAWSAPADVASTNCLIRITDTDNPAATDTSDNVFEVRADITVDDPAASDEWVQGTAEDISWSVTGVVANVKIEYSKDAGGTYPVTVIASRDATLKPYTWAIPTGQDLRTPNQAKIKVSDASYAVCYGTSSNFMMKGLITVTRPDTSDVLHVGDAFNIRWTTTGFYEVGSQVVIGYSVTGSAPFTNIDTVAYDYNGQAYAWTPPIDAITTDLKNAVIEIKDAANPAEVRDESDLFEIEGKIRIDAPDTSGLIWAVGSAQDIKWTPTGTYSPVEIQYSKDNFAGDVQAIATVTNSSSGVQATYAWTIPNDLSDTVRVRVRDDNDDDVYDISSFDVKFVGGLDVTVPESGEVWLKGQSRNITWTATGDITNVKIEYKTSAAGGYTTIVADDAGHIDGGNSYTWTSVADENSQDCYIRISDVAHPADVFAVSEAAFSIRPVITVTAPALNDNLVVGSSGNAIVWDLGGSLKVNAVDVHYSIDGGPYTGNVIASAVSAGDLTCDWDNIPNSISDNVRVRVMDSLNNNVYDESASFDIIGSITVLQPDAGANWQVGTSRNITWTYAGSIGTVNIYYDYGSGYGTPIASVPVADQSYTWDPVPDHVSETVKVKITDADNETEVYDESDTFKIRGAFTLTEPPAVLISGDPYTITWSRTGADIATVLLQFSSNNGIAWSPIDGASGLVPNTGSYSWTVPSDAASTTCLLKVSDPDNADAADTTNATFEVRAKINVTSPVGTDEWNINSTYPVSWTVTGVVANVKIEYSKDGGGAYNEILVVSRPYDQSPYQWTILPAQDVISSQGVVKVSDASYSAVYAESEEFSIIGDVTVDAPAGTDVLTVGTAFNIEWTAVGAGNVVISYSVTGGVPFTAIDTVPYDYNGGVYSWSPPLDSITAGQKLAVIEVKYEDNPNKVRDESEAFEIEGKIRIDAPDTSGLMWMVGSAQDIKWTPTGTYSPVEIQYSKDNFVADIQPIATVVNTASGAQATYSWTIPNDISDTVRVRVRDDNDDDVYDVSSFDIKIVGSLDLTVPESGEVWKKGEMRSIVWTSVGDVSNVKIEYKTSAAGGYTTIVANDPGHTEGGNSYVWTVADENSENCYVRISDVAHPASVSSVSASSFSIRPVITVSAPVLDSNLVVGSSGNAIVWDLGGSISVNPLNVQYSIDGGAYTGNVIASGVSASNLTCNWDNVPDSISGNVKVRVMDSINNNVYDESASFDIIGSVTVTQPTSSANWEVGTTNKNVTWNYTGSIGTVTIYYDYVGDDSWNQIATGVLASAQVYNWSPVPDTISENVRVKVIDSDTEGTPDEVYDISDTFSIRGGFTITFPTNPEVLIAGDGYDITWNRNGTGITNVILEFSSNNGGTWSVIDANATNTGTYSWVAPTSVASTSCLIKITDVDNPTATDTSDNVFEIRSDITVTDPIAADEWVQGAAEDIAWSITGSVANVKIEYSKDGGGSYTVTVIASRDAALTPYSWSIPAAQDLRTPNQAKIKVSDASYAVVYGTSPNFMMKGVITVTAPDTSTVMKVGDAFSIQWTTTGFYEVGSNVVISYSTTGGAPFTLIDTVAHDYNGGSYPWTPPIDSITNDAKMAVIEIKDVGNPTKVRDESDLFEIEGKIRLDSPDIDSPTWLVGNTEQIKWTPTGTFSYVKIEYSTNAFADEGETVVEAANYPNSASGVQASYDWTIPDIVGSDLKVRITAVNDDDVFDVSASPFVVKGNLNLTAPNGGQTWFVGDTNRNITWQSSASVSTIRIEYSSNNGGAYTQIIADAPAGLGAGSYTWPAVADAISDLCLIRVSYTGDSTVNDVSDGVFSIKGKLQVLTPDGSERWLAESSGHDITWAMTGSIANVKITYAVDGSAFDNVIAASVTAGDLSYTWNSLPDHVSDTYRVRVADLNDEALVYATSPQFEIVGAITVTEPGGGEELPVGSDFRVEWGKVGDFANVRIEYSLNGGTSFNYQIVASTAADNLFYWWTGIPETAVSPTVVIRVTDADDIQVYDDSAQFKIQGIFDITAPDGGEVWGVGSDYTITWSTTGNVPNVKLEYSIDGGISWVDPPISASLVNTGSKLWTVPDTISDQVRVKVSDVNDSDASNMSAANFKIRGDLRLTSPSSGSEVWLVASSQPITWQVTGAVATVKLEYAVDGGLYQAIPGAENLTADSGDGTGSFAWTIPDDISDQVKVKITNRDDSTVYDESDNEFTITGQLDFTYPAGGEVFYVGDQETVTWVKTGTIPAVDLEYSVGGAPYQLVVGGGALAGTSFDWVIPDNINGQVRLRVSNSNAAKPTSPGVTGLFAIKGKLELTSPTLGVVWEVAGSEDITWNATGTMTTVTLRYDYGSGPVVINGNVAAGNETYPWTIPNSISDNVTVTITYNGDSAVTDTSDVFKIAADIDLTSPVGGEEWRVGENRAVTWNKYGDIANVVLKYDTNEGLGGFPDTIATVPAINGSYSWLVPDEIGSSLRVRIEDANGASSTVPDESPANFTIRGSIAITSPVLDDVWLCETSHDIAYTITGSIANVSIEYSTDGGASYPYAPISVSQAVWPGSHTYPWTIPVNTSVTTVIKITNLADPANVYDTSDNFIIRGGFNFVAPVSGTRWLANSARNIQWDTLGIINSVYLEYSLNNGAAWDYVNDGSPIVNFTEIYNWTVPNVVSQEALIRITDSSDPEASSTSEVFDIHGAMTLTQPNGQERFNIGQSDENTKIKWTMVGPINTVDIALSTSGAGGPYTMVATSQQASLLEYQWSVPTDEVSNNCFIRIRDSQDTLVEDFSDLAFKIVESFTVLAPIGGEQWEVGTSEDITWSCGWLASGVNIKYSTVPPYNSWTPIVTNTANDGTYSWTIPATISSTCRVRVSDYNDDAESFDISDADFKIQGRIAITAPNGSETWGCASLQYIQWDYDGNISDVDIHYYNGSSWVAINDAQGITNTGEYQWTIPLIATEDALVRVRDSSDPAYVYDVSDNPFKIMGRVVVTSPNGGEVWYAGSDGTITWDKYGPASFDTVKIDYSIGDPTFSDPQSITTGTTNDGSYDWIGIPGEAVSSNVRIRVAHPSDPDIEDISNNDFRIRASFTLTAPNGGQKLTVGDTYTISWSQGGVTQGVKIYCYRQSQTTVKTTIAAAAPTTSTGGTYEWTIPNFIYGDLIMRVEDPNDSDVFDLADGTFKIMAGFTVTSPDADSKWYVNDPAVITWSYTGTVVDVGIYYSTVGGLAGTWNALTSVPAGDLSWPWPSVPDEITSQLKVKVEDASDSDAYGVSAGMAKIRAKFTLTAPAGGEELVVDDIFSLTWNCVGTVANVDLHYSTDDFVSAVNIALGTANTGSYNWTVPDDISPTVKVRVKSSTDDDAESVSADFRIKGDIWLNAPGVDDEWEIGRAYDVAWGWKGTIPEVLITYSVNGAAGPFNPVIENYGTPNDGIVANGAGAGGAGSEHTFSWTVPDEATDQALIRVTDTRAQESDVVSESGLFHIIGYIVVNAPAAGEALAVDSTYDIAWEWGGTIPEVKITYSVNGIAGPFNPVVEDYGTPNDGIVANGAGSGGAGSEHTFNWTVPDDISPQCIVRVADANDEIVYADSGEFKIQGGFTLVTPAVELNDKGTADPGDDVYECRWVTNEVRQVSWITFGTIPKLDLVYSKDDFTTEIPLADELGVEAADVDNTGTFAWQIPDDRSDTVKIRIYDTNDHSVYIEGPIPAGGVDTMKIDYYTITWDIRDLVTNQPISGLTVSDNSGWEATSLSSPLSHDVPAGLWQADWSHKDYGPISEIYLTGWDEDAQRWRGDRTIYRTMETLVVHIWRAYSEFAYEAENDILTINSWLERDGALVSGAIVADVSIYDGIYKIQRRTVIVDEDNNKLLYHDNVDSSVKLWVGDRLGEVRTIDDVIADCAPYKAGEADIPADFTGIFEQLWSPTDYTAGPDSYATLQAGQVYTVTTYIILTTGATFVTPVSFSVDIPKQMKDMELQLAEMTATVASVLDKPLSEVNEELQASLQAQTDLIEGKMEEQVELIDTRTSQMVNTVNETMTSFEQRTMSAVSKLETGAEQAVEAGQSLEETALKYSWNAMVSPDPALTNDVITLSCQGEAALAPILNIYDADGASIFRNIVLLEAEPGLYVYEFVADTKFKVGRSYSYIITESVTGGLVSGSGMVARFDWSSTLFPDPVLVGDRITVQAMGLPNLFPTIGFYDWQGRGIVEGATMTEVSAGFYQYDIVASGAFQVGKTYIYKITESKTDTLLTGSGVVESVTITTVAGLAAAAPEAERAAKKALDAIKSVEAVLISGEDINIALTLKNLKESVEALPDVIAKEGPSATIGRTVNEIAKRLNALAGEEGYDLSDLLEDAIESSPTIKAMNESTEAVGETVDVLMRIFEQKLGGLEDPFVLFE